MAATIVACPGCPDIPPEMRRPKQLERAGDRRSGDSVARPFDAAMIVERGTGRDWQRLLVDQKLAVCELLHERTNTFSPTIYYRLFEDYYANPAELDELLPEVAKRAAPFALFEDDDTPRMIEAARQEEAQAAAAVNKQQRGYRTWTNPASGEEIEAAFSKQIGPIVYLRRRDTRQEVRVNFSDLNEADQQYVRDRAGKK